MKQKEVFFSVPICGHTDPKTKSYVSLCAVQSSARLAHKLRIRLDGDKVVSVIPSPPFPL